MSRLPFSSPPGTRDDDHEHARPTSEERLFPGRPRRGGGEKRGVATTEVARGDVGDTTAGGEGEAGGGGGGAPAAARRTYRVYKRRFFGLGQLVLLNVVVSWDWLTFAAVSTTAAEYFGVSATAVNWLSTGFLFAFVAVTPIVIWTLHRGPKPSIVAAAALVLVGNWVRYAGARARGGNFGAVAFGQVLIGFAQPFVLAAPTRYSELWFSERGRVSATAVASLANPFGAALSQLISPILADKAEKVPNMVLYTTIISTVAALPAFFIPAEPPSPPSASSSIPKQPLGASFRLLASRPSFFLICIPFGIYVGLFNAFSSLLNQILEPYAFTEDEAGIAGAVLILVGLVTAAVLSPILDRLPSHPYLPTIKTLVPLLAVSYLIFAFTPQTRTLAGPYAAAALLGAASFGLIPVALECVAELTWPASVELSSTLCWSLGMLLGGIFIITMNALKAAPDAGDPLGDRPPLHMFRALVFQTVLACVAAVPPVLIGMRRLGFGDGAARGRMDLDLGRPGAGEGVRGGPSWEMGSMNGRA